MATIKLILPDDPLRNGYVVEGVKFDYDTLFNGNSTPDGYFRYLDPIDNENYFLVGPGEYEVVEA